MKVDIRVDDKSDSNHWALTNADNVNDRTPAAELLQDYEYVLYGDASCKRIER